MPTLMERFSSLWSVKEDTDPSPSELSLSELSEKFDIVDVVDEGGYQFAIVTARNSMGEIGTSAPSPWTSFTRQEYNPALMGQKGLVVFDKMRKSDGTIRGSLRSIKTPVQSGRWFTERATKRNETEADIERWKEQAEWVWCNLNDLMTITWPQILAEGLLMCDFGYYMFEKVWENRVIEGEMMTCLTKLAPRHPMDVQEWVFDVHGGPLAVRMNPPSSANLDPPYVKIDIEKLLVFTFDREAGDITGISVLRTAYKHWYFMEQLYKIDAIQKERHGIGIPVIELPMGFKDTDRALADELGRNIRTNERAHIVLPPSWNLYMLKMEGQPVDALESIQQHQAAIRENILVNFIVEGAREEDLTMFFKSARIVADIFASTINTYLIPQMIKYNWPLEERFPKLKVRRIGETADWRTLTFAIRNLVGAGVIIPDGVLEALLREEMDLSAIDEDSARLIATPQNPYDINEDVQDGSTDPADSEPPDTSQGDQTHNINNPNYNRNRRKIARGRRQNTNKNVAGLPRQATVSSMRKSGPFGTPRSGSGNDRSGG